MIRGRGIRAAFSILLTVCFVRAQSPGPAAKFDVVSIKPYNLQDGNFMIRTQPDGTFRAVGATLRMLVMFAYNVKVFQLSGEPGWMKTDMWEIEAKVEG